MENLTSAACTRFDCRATKIVRRLDQRLLAIRHAAADEQQKADFLGWAHQQLLAPVVFMQQHATRSAFTEQGAASDRVSDREDDGAGGAGEHGEPLEFDFFMVDLLRWLLCGGVLAQEDLAVWSTGPLAVGAGTRQAGGPPTFAQEPNALACELTRWLRRRLCHCAQRTRFHDEAELAALVTAAETQLIAGSLVWFELGNHLGVKLPSRDFLSEIGRTFSLAVQGKIGVAWTGTQLVFKPQPSITRCSG